MVGAVADSVARASQFRVYIDHDNRSLLYRLALEQGYIGQVQRIPTRSMTQFILDILNESCTITCTPDMLFRGHQMHIARNLLHLNIPYLLQQAIPGHFKLDNWDQVMVNIAQRKIMPVHGYPSIGKAEVIQDRLERVNDEAPRRAQLGQIYPLNTDITGEELNNILPVLDPLQYRDNRPDPASDKGRSLALQGPQFSHLYRWYIPGLARRSRHLYIPDAQVKPILAIGEHWHILPARTRSINVRMCVVLEAIAHNLLVPIE